jgi:N-acetylglutamate synthase-like GNAT family acetyltransferase
MEILTMSETILRAAREDDRISIMKVMESANMHSIPSPEMPELDLSCFFVAEVSGIIVGAAGYRILSPTTAKTTLMAVLPEYKGKGIGNILQTRRMEEMYQRGIKILTTNADLPETISWYQKHFGYRPIGKLNKQHEFGNPNISEWTTLEVNLEDWKHGNHR